MLAHQYRKFRRWMHSLCRATRQAHTLLILHERATRLELRSVNHAARARRLRLHILSLCGVRAPAGLDDAAIARRASEATLEFIQPLRKAVLKRMLTAVAGFTGLGLLGLVIVLAVPNLRRSVFPPDLGRNATWTASSQMANFPISGTGTVAPLSDGSESSPPLFFHTQNEQDPYLDIDLGGKFRVRRVRIENRTDCCGARALPLNVELPGEDGTRLVCQRRSPFQTWTCDLDGALTRRIRITHPGKGILHLRKIEVFE